MRFDEAYQAWGQEDKNRELYKNTKTVVRKAIWTLPTNQPCSYFTLAVLARAFTASTLPPADKAKAASVICHVLKYAHTVDPDHNPNPGFIYSDINDYAGPNNTIEREGKERTPEMCLASKETSEPVAEPEEKVKPEAKAKRDGGKAAKDAEKAVVQIDPISLKVIKVWPSTNAVTKQLGIQNIKRAIERHGQSGGYYWCRLGEEKGFKPMDNRVKKVAEKIFSPIVVQKPEPAPAPEPVIEDVRECPTLLSATDEEIIEEIRRRGWKGTFSIVKTIELN